MIHDDQEIYLEKPELFLPDGESPRGRTPKRLKVSIEAKVELKEIDFDSNLEIAIDNTILDKNQR
jgi:hypothetical protein